MENTYHKPFLYLLVWDHLHIRGEYYDVVPSTLLQDRITSTYVENTSYAQSDDIEGEDHLHIRGEYDFHSLEW